ncbi:CBU_0592 family membrane protein [Daejeonella sp.]|uniref:CBU_0592 family membrane protein n=1 Tax=Daejeonella sp. TaxID=2805397 RepID=UPI003C75EE06
MSESDIIGSIGVTLLLIAFLLNLKGVLSTSNLWYILLNILGAALCGISAYMISFYPFVILESVWVVAALSSLFSRVSRETLNK